MQKKGELVARTTPLFLNSVLWGVAAGVAVLFVLLWRANGGDVTDVSATARDRGRILVTGGSGLLGGELKHHLPDGTLYPSSKEFNVADLEQVQRYLLQGPGRGVGTLLHCAAFTDVPKAREKASQVIDTNIIGTANLAKLCGQHGIRLVYISTDYVFDGSKGGYKETDPVLPQNPYAWSKLGGECAVQLCPGSTIIRLTFGPNAFPYPKAFVDQYTSRESVTVTARKVASVVRSNHSGIIHIGYPQRRSVLEYAQSLDPNKEIGRLSINDVSFNPPKDTSLNTELYQRLGLN